MKIAYDKRVDSLNMTLKPGKVAKTIEIAPEVFLDVDKKGNPLYLEIVGASDKIGKKNFLEVTVGEKSFRIPAAA
jgi:uncharacterized protein YuzE